MTLLLTRPFTDEIEVRDAADSWALNHERFLRELRWRHSHGFPTATVSLPEVILARDAGDVCHACKTIVTWTDHLPPLEAGGPVRCFVGSSGGSAKQMWELQHGERRQGDAIVYSAAFIDTTGPEAV